MPLIIPLPTANPQDDISQYVGLLVSAVDVFLEAKDIWAEEDYDTAYEYMENLKVWLVENIPCP